LEEALAKQAEAQAKLADFMKRYRSVKAKVNRLIKEFASTEEETYRSSIHHMTYDVQLAANKFVLIDKKLKNFKRDDEHSCKDALKTLRSPKGFDAYQTTWYIGRVAFLLQRTDSLLFDINDKLRIAKGHLDKVDKHKKYLRKLWRFRATYLPR
jgi:hypothetical protein